MADPAGPAVKIHRSGMVVEKESPATVSRFAPLVPPKSQNTVPVEYGQMTIQDAVPLHVATELQVKMGVLRFVASSLRRMNAIVIAAWGTHFALPVTPRYHASAVVPQRPVTPSRLEFQVGAPMGTSRSDGGMPPNAKGSTPRNTLGSPHPSWNGTTTHASWPSGCAGSICAPSGGFIVPCGDRYGIGSRRRDVRDRVAGHARHNRIGRVQIRELDVVFPGRQKEVDRLGGRCGGRGQRIGQHRRLPRRRRGAIPPKDFDL